MNSEIIGFLWYEITRSTFIDRNIGYILDIYIKPEFREKGCGKELITNLVDKLLSIGINRIDLSVYKTNNAKRLYESIGFEETMIKMTLLL